MTRQAGVVLQGVDEAPRFEEMAREIEALGYEHLWLTDSSLHSRDAYAYLSLAARVTERIGLGTAVTNPLTRHPGVTAMGILTVDAVSAGRAMLGIGPGDRPVAALGFEAARLSQMRASIAAIRRLLAGETVTEDFDGFSLHDAHIRFEGRADLPIFISASGPRMLELAGEIADGVIVLSGLFREGVDFALEHIDAGASRADRPRPHVALMAYGAIDEDEQRALEPARTIAAWFPQTAPRYCELAGLDPELMEYVRSSYSGGEFQEAAKAAAVLPTEFVKKMAIAGTPEQITQQLRDTAALGIDSVHVFPLGERRMETVRHFAACWDAASQEIPPS